MTVIGGVVLKELHCKNDDCRKLLGYEKIKTGILAFQCPRCKSISVFKINYPAGQELIDQLESLNSILKGGDK